MPREGVKDGQIDWAPATHVGDPDETDSWLWPGLALDAVAVWGMNQQIEDGSLPLCSLPQVTLIFERIKCIFKKKEKGTEKWQETKRQGCLRSRVNGAPS